MTDTPRPATLLRDTVPTTKHAGELFDRVLARLGPRAVVQTANEGKCRRVYVRAGSDGSYVVPWPLLTLTLTDPPSEGDATDERIPRMSMWMGGNEIPLEFHAVPATLTVGDGALSLVVNYRADGRWQDTVQPAEQDAFEDLVSALAKGPDTTLGRLVEYVVGIDLSRHGPVRVLLPRPMPGGVEGVWHQARSAIRGAMAARRTPGGSFWAVADGVAGTAIAFGSTREEALAGWRLEVERVRPQPPAPVDPSEPEASSWGLPAWRPEASPEADAEGGHGAGGWDAPPHDPAPSLVPAAILRVAALPSTPPPRGTWTRWIGDRGVTHHAMRIPGPEGGFTLVGEALIARLGGPELDGTLDAIDEAGLRDARRMGLPARLGGPASTHSVVVYRCVDAATGLAIDPRAESSCIGAGFDARGFDGSCLRTHIVRVRRLHPEPDVE